MRRIWATALFVAACYRPTAYDDCAVRCGEGACPPGLACESATGYCTSGPTCARDGGFDGRLPEPCELGLYAKTPAVQMQMASDYNHGAYTTDVGRERSAFETLVQAALQPTFGPVVDAVITTPMFAASNALHVPHLSPEGDEAFLINVDTAGKRTFAVSKRNGVSWGAPRALAVLIDGAEFIAGPIDTPATPTVHSSEPRLMIAQNGGELTELRESPSTADRWEQVQAYAPSDLGLAAAFQPQLSPDGLRLVMRAVPLAGNVAGVYGFTRASRSERFTGPPRELLGNAGLVHPFLSHDCGYLYAWNFSTGFVERYDALP